VVLLIISLIAHSNTKEQAEINELKKEQIIQNLHDLTDRYTNLKVPDNQASLLGKKILVTATVIGEYGDPTARELVVKINGPKGYKEIKLNQYVLRYRPTMYCCGSRYPDKSNPMVFEYIASEKIRPIKSSGSFQQALEEG